MTFGLLIIPAVHFSDYNKENKFYCWQQRKPEFGWSLRWVPIRWSRKGS